MNRRSGANEVRDHETTGPGSCEGSRPDYIDPPKHNIDP